MPNYLRLVTVATTSDVIARFTAGLHSPKKLLERKTTSLTGGAVKAKGFSTCFRVALVTVDDYLCGVPLSKKLFGYFFRKRKPSSSTVSLSASFRNSFGQRVGGKKTRQWSHLGFVVEDGGFDGAVEELLGVAGEELVEGVVAGDVDGEAAGAAAGATPHLAEAGDGSGEGDHDRGVE